MVSVGLEGVLLLPNAKENCLPQISYVGRGLISRVGGSDNSNHFSIWKDVLMELRWSKRLVM